MYVCMYVCMYGNEFTIEICGFYVPLWHVPLMTPSTLRIRRMEDNTRTSQDVWKTVNCSTKG